MTNHKHIPVLHWAPVHCAGLVHVHVLGALRQPPFAHPDRQMATLHTEPVHPVLQL